jgi:Leucine-rich repeat (LRR) protein
MAEIAKLKKLKRFGCRLADVTGEGIKHLAELTELTRLELRETSLDDEGMEVLSNLPKLSYLDISECRLISGDGIARLGKLTSLTFLELREIKKVKDDSFANLATLTNLVDLNVSATRITDESAPILLKMQKLERLSVAGSQMGDAGIVQLGQLPALKWLDLTASNPTEDTIKALKAARPNLEILSAAN